MSSEQTTSNSPVLTAQSDLSMMEAPVNNQVINHADRTLQAIDRLREMLATCSSALADAIEHNMPEENKNSIRQTIAATEGDLVMLISAHGHLVRSSPVQAEQTAPQSRLVPRELPVFQWQGNEWDHTQKVYASIEECLDKFEDVLHSYSMDLNVDWHRLLPIVLSREQRSWFDNYLRSSPELPWSFARDAFIKAYGINDLERRVQLTHELMLMRMRTTESVSNYTDRYQRVRREADVADNMQAAIAYTSTLLPELARQVSLLQVNMPREKRDTIDKAASLARSIYSTVFLTARSNEPVARAHTLGSEQVSRTSSSSSAGRSSGSSRENAQSRERSTHKRCSLHGKGNHDTEDCRILKNALATKGGNRVEKAPHANKYVGSAPCRWCGEVWSHKHRCSSVSGSSSSSGSASGSPRGSAPHFAVRSIHTVTNDSTPSDASSSEDDQSMVMDFEQCSTCKYTSTHTDHNKRSTHSYLVPISLEEEKLWALVDTGATISSVSTKICSKLGWPTIPRNGKIVLATNNAIAHRLGVTKPIKVFYNNKHIIHSFEVLDLAENIDVSIGTDLMPSLGIHLLGLAESWYGSNTPQTPTPIAEIEKPNNAPAGTPTEHSQFMKALLPFIKANEAIPITSFCTVKESIVRLPTPPGQVVYRRQYPIALQLVPLMAKHINQWLTDGTIQRAPMSLVIPQASVLA
ncbi:hypothetical protein PHYBLDRAFT_71588 [Phycomyces blakesleeanus NRRL 1555(-)]|uniref:Retrotransposon gag domain-containing protein n=1 Tax=Phycomyces blakesleeanus (strain ATCC 8743b / DSM 1359 / FGSC 10004 / NBRC 33097 / NRRL 1555) TaxID=763407 RepID=A0A162U361_PHYB8|nr:hypothetical protein PHYBLDRAFT_71588 [Phycomyces blakesleeanus NRRL 1555(-)]OAD73082.1 hypothetical protein PHYBLDRAFT_71588 [Phycomyces blakesleeanus NRRL 1555(-)]|eukprot:XP_018291122.1 hypothetical protein PHYBLDRAFT_71588 [Phycomyces blakesleeanus NRRL 1555(-)]